MSAGLTAALRAGHVVASSFWLGVMLLNAGFLIPAVQAAGPAGGQVMKHLVQVRRLPAYLNAAVLVTLLTGLWLLWWTSGGFSSAWVRSGRGAGLLAASALTLIAALLGQFVNAPTARRMGQAMAQLQASGGPPSAADLAEIQGMQARLWRATVLAAGLLGVAAVLMAVSRYVA